MKRSDEAARIYAALALKAAGRAVDRQSVAEICDQLGLPADQQAVTALVHLLAFEEEPPAASPDAEPLADRDAAADANTSGRPWTSVREASKPGKSRQPEPIPQPIEQSNAVAEDIARWVAVPPPPPPETEEAFYLYGFVEGETLEDRDLAGIEGRRVEAISCDGVTALGHRCPAVPYSASDAEIMIGWIEEHDAVLRQTLSTHAAVVPCKFNTMIKPGDRTAREAVRDWLEERHDELGTLFARVRDRMEYGLRVLSQSSAGYEGTAGDPPDESSGANARVPLPPGVRYLMQEQLKRRSAEQRLLAQADLRARCLAALAPLTDGIAEQRRDGAEEEDQLVLRCACLVPKDMSDRFFDILEHLRTVEHVTIQVTGPWPAYSFVGDQALGAAGQ